MRKTALSCSGLARFLYLVIPLLALFLLLPCLFGIGQAQVVPPITSSGLNTQVSAPIPLPTGKTQYDITGGTRAGGGTNLFHSFGEFNVPTNNIANFFNETGASTSNILGRVTGGNLSSIYGTIQTENFGSANLFLINPAGVLFGATATLNVGGNFYVGTADYLRLTDGAQFSAIPDSVQDALLTSAPVAAFGFLGSNPGAIAIQGSQLSVAEGQGISLVGGNITVESGTLDDGTVQPARLSAPGGQINLASEASAGEFLVSSLESVPNINGESFSSFGRIHLATGSTVDITRSGTVSIRGGEFVLDINNASLTTEVGVASSNGGSGQSNIVLTNGSQIIAETRSSSPSGDIGLTASSLQVSGGSTIRTHTTGGGDAGNINLTMSESLNLQGVDPSGNPSRILSDTESAGSSGAINIQAPSGSVVLDGGVIETRTTSDGLAGDINLTVRDLTAQGGAQIVTGGSDAAPSGSITIEAKDTISLSGRPVPSDPSSASGIFNVNTGFNGTGSISIQTGSLLMRKGARIRNDALFDLSGTETSKISIAARDAVALSGGSGIIVDTTFSDVGPLAISARSISLSDVSVISTRTVGLGNGGQVTLSADSLSVIGGSRVVSATDQDVGRAGDVSITVTDRLTISGQGVDQNGGTVSSGIFTFSSPFATGDAGQVSILAGTVEISGGGQINSSTFGSGNGGTITMQGVASPAESILIDGAGSGIFTDAQGTGAGGNINLFAQSLTLQNGATLSAATSGTAASATGGTIMVNALVQEGQIIPTAAQSVTLSNGATISASSTAPANAGEIVINAGNQFQSTNGTVTTEASQASGGSITLMAGDMVHLVNSKITTSVQGGAETRGGDITIDPQFVILQNSQILATATQGNGGDITITAGTFLADPASVVSASSQLGVSGTVNIQSPVQNFSSSLAPLPKNFQSAAALLAQRCAARAAGGQVSTFVMAGREGLPAEPGGFLTSPPYRTSATGLAGEEPVAFASGVLVAMADRFPVWDIGCRFDSAER